MGLEPTTPCLQSRCSSQLSYVPQCGETPRIAARPPQLHRRDACDAHSVDGRARFRRGAAGYPWCMRRGNIEIRPLGGAPGCLMMILFSIVASVLLTFLVNVIIR
jgi:hypothetical protein